MIAASVNVCQPNPACELGLCALTVNLHIPQSPLAHTTLIIKTKVIPCVEQQHSLTCPMLQIPMLWFFEARDVIDKFLHKQPLSTVIHRCAMIRVAYCIDGVEGWWHFATFFH